MLEVLLIFVGISSVAAMVIGKFSAIESWDITYYKKQKARK